MTGVVDMVETSVPATDLYNHTTATHGKHSTSDPLWVPEEGLRPQSIILITTILLGCALVLGLVAVILSIILRRRKGRQGRMLKKKLPPVTELGREVDVINGVAHEAMDVLFDRQKFKGSSKSSKKSKAKKRTDEKCRSCLDRGHFECQGHQHSRSSSISSKDRTDLNFIEPGGFYEHVKVQTDRVAGPPEVHVYSKLEDATSGPVPAPRMLKSTPDSLLPNYYTNLHEATSGAPLMKTSEDNVGVEYEYSTPVDHYEELPNLEGKYPGKPGLITPDTEPIYSNIDSSFQKGSF